MFLYFCEKLVVMKKILLFATIIMASILLKAQDDSLNPYSFTEVVKVENKSAGDIYYQSKIWLADTYKSAKDVIQIDDKENNTIVGKGTLKYNSKIFAGGAAISGTIDYTIRIMAKDGRYKYEFTDFIHQGNDRGSSFGLILNTDNPALKIGWEKWRIKVYKEIKETIDRNIKPIEESLKNSLNKEKPNNDW